MDVLCFVCSCRVCGNEEGQPSSIVTCVDGVASQVLQEGLDALSVENRQLEKVLPQPPSSPFKTLFHVSCVSAFADMNRPPAPP